MNERPYVMYCHFCHRALYVDKHGQMHTLSESKRGCISHASFPAEISLISTEDYLRRHPEQSERIKLLSIGISSITLA